MGQPERYSRVYLLCAKMVLDEKGEHVFPAFNSDGLVNGGTRVHAAKIMLEKKLTPAIFPVGGIDTDGFDKIAHIARLVSEETEKSCPLYSMLGTQGNSTAIHDHLAKNPPAPFMGYAQVGILTEFYHLPRAMRMMFREQSAYHLVPVCAEAILFLDNNMDALILRTYISMRHYLSPKAMERLLAEMRGLAALERGSYGD